MRTIKIGTRGSKLALIQTETVKKSISNIRPDLKIATHIIQTSGDLLDDMPLDKIGGKGVFVKDIEKRLLRREIDIAVHSLKDMQASLPQGLIIGAFLKRDDPRDMLLPCSSMAGCTIETLPKGASIGTSSLRRRCQIKDIRPDIRVIDIRGNIPTRLKKVGSDVDAVILACAGVKRIGLPAGTPIDIDTMIPAPGQGVIAVEVRQDDREVQDIIKSLDHEHTRICAQTERAFLSTLGADCHFPVAAYAILDSNSILIRGMVGRIDEHYMVKKTIKGDPASAGRVLAEMLSEEMEGEGVRS
ncbi:MAG: hydroxymethylbilane synthase [Deltaproteobacteria bacterium]|nr:hydroxymethylbilane synthase [Deltaproteobacteria bacterium]